MTSSHFSSHLQPHVLSQGYFNIFLLLLNTLFSWIWRQHLTVTVLCLLSRDDPEQPSCFRGANAWHAMYWCQLIPCFRRVLLRVESQSLSFWLFVHDWEQHQMWSYVLQVMGATSDEHMIKDWAEVPEFIQLQYLDIPTCPFVCDTTKRISLCIICRWTTTLRASSWLTTLHCVEQCSVLPCSCLEPAHILFDVCQMWFCAWTLWPVASVKRKRIGKRQREKKKTSKREEKVERLQTPGAHCECVWHV